MSDVGSGRRCVRAVSAAVTLLVAAVVVVGCAGQQHKSIGRTYTSAGDYDRAVEAAKQSLAKSPDSSECIDLLSDAQTAAADFHFKQAKKLMEAQRPVSASAELELVLGYMPAHPGGNQLLVQVRAALARRDELIGKAQAAAGREDWGNAAALAEQACGVDRDNKPAQALLSQARSVQPTTAVVASPAPVSAPRTETPTAPVQVVVAKPQAAVMERGRAAEKANGQVSAARSSGEADRHLMLGIISRDDQRFNKIMAIMDGVTVKIHDADKNPLDVDLEIVAGKFKISPKDVPVGGSVKFQGVSKRQYKLTVLWIDYEHESVKFAIDRAD